MTSTHCLIKDVDELDEDTAKSIMAAFIILSKAIKEIYHPDGINVCQNGGIFNELTHYHMHVVPRYKEQSLASFYSEYGGNIEKADKLKETQAKMLESINQIV